MKPRDHTFTDEQVRAIFAAAAERQSEAERAAATAGSGHTLDDLARIGAEVGIDPVHVEAAALSVLRRSGGVPSRGQQSTVVEAGRTLPGRIDDGAWEPIVRMLRQELRVTGVTTRFGEVREWVSSTTGPGSAPLEVRIEPGNGSSTTVSLRRDLSPHAQVGTALGIGFTGVAALLAVLLVLGTFDAALLALPASFFALGMASLLGGRALLPWLARRERERLVRRLDDIELIARRSAPPASEVESDGRG